MPGLFDNETSAFAVPASGEQTSVPESQDQTAAETVESSPVEAVVSDATASISTALALPGAPITAVALYKDAQSVDEGLAELRRRALAELGDADISTKAGRAKIASVAYMVAKSKVGMAGLGKNLTEEWRNRTALVNAECRRIETEADALKDEIRKPLTDWEDAEKDRVEAHEAALNIVQRYGIVPSGTSAQDIRWALEKLDEIIEQKRDWQEFSQRATTATDRTRQTLTDALLAAESREAAAAKVEAARGAEEERLRQEREAEIARQAAETARLAAEEAAAEEAARVAEVARLDRERIQREAEEAAEERRLEVIRVAEEAAADRRRIQAAADETEWKRKDLEAQLAQAEQARKDDAERADAQRLAAARLAETNRLAAIEAERQRVANAKKAEDDATAAREKNRKHVAGINNEVLAALKGLGVVEEIGKAIIAAIVRGAISHTKIEY